MAYNIVCVLLYSVKILFVYLNDFLICSVQSVCVFVVAFSSHAASSENRQGA